MLRCRLTKDIFYAWESIHKIPSISLYQLLFLLMSIPFTWQYINIYRSQKQLKDCEEICSKVNIINNVPVCLYQAKWDYSLTEKSTHTHIWSYKLIINLPATIWGIVYNDIDIQNKDMIEIYDCGVLRWWYTVEHIDCYERCWKKDNYQITLQWSL